MPKKQKSQYKVVQTSVNYGKRLIYTRYYNNDTDAYNDAKSIAHGRKTLYKLQGNKFKRDMSFTHKKY